MSVNGVSRIVNEDFRVTLQIVVSLTDSIGIIYNHKMFKVRARKDGL